jgi:hypothetical protein
MDMHCAVYHALGRSCRNGEWLAKDSETLTTRMKPRQDAENEDAVCDLSTANINVEVFTKSLYITRYF